MHKENIGQTEFVFKLADNQKEIESIYYLRYQVYCEECNFIKPQDYPDCKEQDKYDKDALQFLARDKYWVIGSARMIPGSAPGGLPIEGHCPGLNLFNGLNRENTAEISRLIISKDYRRRKEDGLYYTPEYNAGTKAGQADSPIRRIRIMTFGLYRELYQESKRRHITHWFALMTKALWALLNMHGFIFRPLGPAVDFYGPVIPYIGNIEEIEASFYKGYPEYFVKYFLDGLEEEFYPKNLIQ